MYTTLNEDTTNVTLHESIHNATTVTNINPLHESNPKTMAVNDFTTASNYTFNSLDDIHQTIWQQIKSLQEEGDCEEKKIVICENIDNYAGLGSMVHRYGACLQIAFGLGRMWFINQPQYNHFGGLSAFLEPESTKCGYLKEKYKDAKDSCNVEDKNHYKSNGYDIDNSCKVFRYNSMGRFPHPRHIPTTLPLEIEKALIKFNVTDPWLWFTSQFLGYLLLRHNSELARKIESITSSLNLRHPYVAMHVRRGDKIKSGEAKLVTEEIYLRTAESYFDRNLPNETHRRVYVASDKNDMAAVLKNKLSSSSFKSTDYELVTRPDNQRTSHISYFSSKFPKEIFEELIIDLYFLTHSNYSICTFSSNIGRLVYALKQTIPPYIASDRIVSLDFPYDMVYLWQGYSNYWIRTFWVTTESNNETRTVNGQQLFTYQPGQMFDFSNKNYTYVENGREEILVLGWLDRVYRTDGFVFKKHLKKWPGSPVYHFYD